MAASKYNVLHWHITDSYSFSYQSETFPDLTAAGAWPKMTCASDSGDQCVYAYSPQQIQQVVKYANDRGIRSVVEVDVPGHAYAWGLSEKYKSVTTDCPNYVDELGHVDDIPLDPSQDLTYEVVRDMVGMHASDDHWVSSSDKEVDIYEYISRVFDVCSFMYVTTITNPHPTYAHITTNHLTSTYTITYHSYKTHINSYK